MKPIIGFAGNGHLMENSAAAASIKGFKKITYTPGKTGDDPKDLNNCDIVYICPDRPSNTTPEAMVSLVLPHLRQDATLVIFCQVTPGFMKTIKWPRIRLYYQVETLRIKDAMDRALNPERIIIGSCDKAIDARFLSFLEVFNCPIIYMSYESAELAKIAINIYLAAQVSATNTLSEVADEIGANWNEIIPALQSDKRIGKEAYLQPGFGLSQHLERDLNTINQFEVNTSVTKAFLKHSEYRRKKAP